jgi:cellulose synthase/poly-beta-1,6-N-acetylglucosamine synthase-like glycosyltransferase
MSWAEIIFWFCGLLIFHTYVGYPLLLHVIVLFTSRERQTDEHYLPAVSMLVAAYDEEAIIEEKLKNFHALDYPRDRLQILIGSDGSGDRTNEIVQKYADDKIRLIPFPQRRGKAAVLNDIAGMAQGDILVFSDANSMYSADAIRRLVWFFVDGHVGGVCGRLRLVNADGQLEADGERLYWDYENHLKYLEGKIKTVFGANGAIYAIRRELFSALPTQNVVIDDFLIPMRIVRAGYEVVYEKEALVWECTSPDVRSEFQRKVRIGAGNFHGVREILPLLNPLRGFVAFGLWSHKIIRWIVPFLLIVVFSANFLLRGDAFYDTLFILQGAFYGLVITAWILDCFKIHARWLIYPYYFVAANLALLIGFFKFLTKSQKPAWTRIER